MTTDPTQDPEGLALVHRIHTRKLLTDLERAKNNLYRLRSQATALGTLPQAIGAWELAHEAAGVIGSLESRLQQQRWAA